MKARTENEKRNAGDVGSPATKNQAVNINREEALSIVGEKAIYDLIGL